MWGICSISIAILATIVGSAPEVEMASRKMFGYKNLTEYHPGSANSRIIITAPHGGNTLDDDIPDRNLGCYDDAQETCQWKHNCSPASRQCKAARQMDLYTKEIAQMLQQQLMVDLGETPHLVLNNLHRKKMDPNRERDEGTFGDSEAGKVWDDFHRFIVQSRNSVQGRALLVDIHGQAHPDEWIELGYLFKRADLEQAKLKPKDSSIRTLAKHVSIPFNDLVRGSQSLGGLLQAEGYKTIPSPVHPDVGNGKYYSGGYITQLYGSKNGGEIDAIQVESPRTLRNSEAGPTYALALSRSIATFVNLYYARETTTAEEATPTSEGKTTMDSDNGSNGHDDSAPEPKGTDQSESSETDEENAESDPQTDESRKNSSSPSVFLYHGFLLILALFLGAILL